MIKIKLERLLSNTPIPLINGLHIYQPTVQEIIDMGEVMYWSLLKIWCLNREELVPQETPETSQLSDYQIWCLYMLKSREMQVRCIQSVDLFLHTKIEFLSVSNTIVIGENESSTIIDENFYNMMKDICTALFNVGSEEKEEQYKETPNMSEREREMIRKMKAREEKLNQIRNVDGKSEDRFAKQIVSLVAIGGYTFDEVYNMTLVQMMYLLKKYVAIQRYELYTGLSPYMDSKKSQPPEHWLDV
jgi:hypothetical protein